MSLRKQNDKSFGEHTHFRDSHLTMSGYFSYQQRKSQECRQNNETFQWSQDLMVSQVLLVSQDLMPKDQIDKSPCGARLIFRGEHRCQGYSPIAPYVTHTLASSRARRRLWEGLQSLSPGRQRVSHIHVSEVGISTYWGESARSHRTRLFLAVWKSPSGWTLSEFVFTPSMRVVRLKRVTPAFLFPERQWHSKAGVVEVLWLRPCAHTRVSIVCCSVLQCAALCRSVL